MCYVNLVFKELLVTPRRIYSHDMSNISVTCNSANVIWKINGGELPTNAKTLNMITQNHLILYNTISYNTIIQ